METKSKKYWYRKNIYACVVCGKEKVDKERVYKEDEKGIKWYDEACHSHF